LIFLEITSKIFTSSLKKLAGVILKPFDAVPNYSVTLVSEEHIKRMIDAGLERGELDEEEHEILENVLEFNDLTAYDVMIPRTEMAAVELCGDPEADFKSIIRTGYNSVPIYEESLDNITGIVNVKELMRYYIVNNDYEISRAIRPPHFVPETKYISELLKEMQLKGIRAAIVADEYGGTEGIIKLEDILSEIVGDITYQTEGEPAEVTGLADGSFMVLGNMSIVDFNDQFDAELPESDEYSTLAGFISDVTGKILNPGDLVTHDEYTFELTKRIKNKMAEFRVTKS
jgi:CBS domain containing-hemolysin-like protein